MSATEVEPVEHVSVFSPTLLSVPSGHSGLPRELVTASQRQRLLHGVTTVVAARGYGPATVAEISAAAGVSKKTFYEHFPDKLGCFLAAYAHGRDALNRVVTEEVRGAVEAGMTPVEQLRRGNRRYLAFLAAEEQYARMFFLEVLVAGPQGVAEYTRCRSAFEAQLRTWHQRARAGHPGWPEVDDVAYEAAIGLAHDLALMRITNGQGAELVDLGEDLLTLELTILRVPDAVRRRASGTR